MAFLDKIKQGFKKTKEAIDTKFVDVFGKGKEIDEIIDEIEEVLILSDVGMNTSVKVCDALRVKSKVDKLKDEDQIKEALRYELEKVLERGAEENEDTNLKRVILVTGVNGVGKTTSIGKLAYKFKSEGKKVLVAAADTFRAGAVEQVEIWTNRANVDLIKGRENEEPASVIFDATKKMKAENYDILICDTAGRLHNKKNLMDELEKMKNIIERNLPEVHKDTYIVLDGTTGQNAMLQAKNFNERTNVNGIIITKLDGTAKGGVVFSITDELDIPVKYIGVGEQMEDLEEFNPKAFVESII
ncbi:MAG: signal recognition particle-docking protein FtsY [Clostridia bacterium]